MTEYLIQIPISCRTWHKFTGLVQLVAWYGFLTTVMFMLGVINAIAAHAVLGTLPSTNPFVSVVTFVLMAIAFDWIFVWVITDYYEVRIRVACIRETVEG